MPAPPSPRAPWLPWFLLPLVVLGFSALWVLAALYSGRQCSFMAVVGAIDVLWVLGLASRLAPARRAMVAAAATTLIIALSNWTLIATHVGGSVGLAPWDSFTRLGFDHALTLAQLANRWQDAVWLLAALAVALGGPFLSARLRAPSAR